MGKILTFGEIMLRLTPQDGHVFLQNDILEATFGGGEANVAVSLANLGDDAAFLTCLPENPIGQAAINSMRYFGVDTTNVIRCGERIGVYYMEKGASQRPSRVIYDRKNSSIATSTLADYDWERIFDGVDWLHFTGITPALSASMREVTRVCLEEAKKRGVTVSCDLNYRKKLWTTQEAYAAMTSYMPYVDVCIGNEEDAEKVLGIKAENTNVDAGEVNYDSYRQVAQKMKDAYGFSHVAISLRTSISASDNDWAAMLYDGNDYHFSRTYHIHIFDRVGGGDSFAGGLIHALHSNMSGQDAIEFAVAASCLKHSIQGDFSRFTVADVESLIKGGGSGRVQR